MTEEISREKLTFRQAEGLVIISGIQKRDELNERTRIALWNAVYSSMQRDIYKPSPGKSLLLRGEWLNLSIELHTQCFNKPLDEHSKLASRLIEPLKELITISSYDWVFEVVTYIIRSKNCPYNLPEKINDVLRGNQAAWTISGENNDTLFPVSSEHTEWTYENVSQVIRENELYGSGKHLQESANLFRSGNFHGSIRESIHAVESVARRVTGKSTLGDALKSLESKGVKIQPVLLDGFKKIYGYTNAAQGVRHAIIDESAEINEADAQFMLSACAAFVTYLANQGNKVGINF